jgi:carbon-monoxide dehydrogenase large subunit
MVRTAAREIKIDPAEIRRRNFIPADGLPVPDAGGLMYDCGDYPPIARARR